MFPYFLTFILVALLSVTADKAKPVLDDSTGRLISGSQKNYRMFVVSAALVLILVAGLRYQVGTDYMSYTRSYEFRADSVWQDIVTFHEPGLGVLSLIAHIFGNDYVYMFLIAAIVSVWLYVRTISRYSTSFAFGMLLYLFIGSWHNSFNAVRQYLAAAVLFAGHRYILDRKFFKYLIVVVVATAFHRTALIMLPVYFMVGRKFTILNAIIIFLATLVLRFSYEYLFDIMSFLKGHEQSEYEYMQTSVNVFRILVAIPPIFLVFLLPEDYRNEPENSFYMSMLIVNAGFLIAMRESAYLARVAIYTETYAAIAIPRFASELSPRNRKVVTTFVIVLYFIYWVYEISQRDSLNHFQWIWNR